MKIFLSPASYEFEKERKRTANLLANYVGDLITIEPNDYANSIFWRYNRQVLNIRPKCDMRSMKFDESLVFTKQIVALADVLVFFPGTVDSMCLLLSYIELFQEKTIPSIIVNLDEYAWSYFNSGFGKKKLEDLPANYVVKSSQAVLEAIENVTGLARTTSNNQRTQL